MSSRGRHRNPRPSVRIVLSGWLHPEYDADILAWFQAIPKGQRMNAFKTALRSGGVELNGSSAGDQEEAQVDAENILNNWEF